MRSDKIRRKGRKTAKIEEERDKEIKKREAEAAGYVDAGWWSAAARCNARQGSQFFVSQRVAEPAGGVLKLPELTLSR
jgi:hypothetical protein